MGVIEGQSFLQRAVERLGLPAETRRIVIDAEVGEIVKVYVETFADERWLDVLPTDPSGVQIIGASDDRAERISLADLISGEYDQEEEETDDEGPAEDRAAGEGEAPGAE